MQVHLRINEDVTARVDRYAETLGVSRNIAIHVLLRIALTFEERRLGTDGK